MSVALDVQAAQDRVIRRSDKAANAALRLWRGVEPSSLDASWALAGPRIEAVAVAAAVANARTAGATTRKVAAADRMAGDELVPEAFAGVDGSGRGMGSLLHGAVTTTKQAVGAGMSIADAMVVGGSYLTLMLKTALSDVERSASLAGATGQGYVRYVRLVNPGACSRCAILAGSDRFRRHFERHPGCRCSTVPIRDGEGAPAGLFDSPKDYFDSLPVAEQDRVFTKSGAEAIRLGADPVDVVNARRGATRARMDGAVTYAPVRIQRSVIGYQKDGTPITGYVTTEATSRRGSFGGANGKRPRLMPESIIGLTDDVEMRKTLLRDAGYTRPATRDQSNNDWLRDMRAQREQDRRTADAFYRSKGIQIG